MGLDAAPHEAWFRVFRTFFLTPFETHKVCHAIATGFAAPYSLDKMNIFESLFTLFECSDLFQP